MPWHIIGNPIAGGGRGAQAIAALEQALRAAGVACEVFLTRAAGHAHRRAATLDADTAGVAVVGGDGTLNEVLNGLPDPDRFPLTQLPMGTANLLARELNLPWNPAGTARMIQAGKVRRVDLGTLTPLPSGERVAASSRPGEGGCCAVDRLSAAEPSPLTRRGAAPSPLRGEGRRFLLVASAGFDAMVIQDIQAHRRGKLGLRGYVLPVLRTLAHYRRPRLRVTVDDHPPVEGALVVASNIRCYAGLFCVTDRACCDSGRLDVCILHRGSPPALLSYALSARRRGLSHRRDVTYLTGARVRIESDQPVAVEADGEYLGTTPVELVLHPAAVPVVVP